MDLNGMNYLLSLITLGFGLYCFYAWSQLCGGKIPEKFVLLPREFSPDKCIDQEVYISYIRPRLMIFGIAMTASGAFALADARWGLVNQWFPDYALLLRLLLTSILPFAVIVWFAVCLHKIQKELW